MPTNLDQPQTAVAWVCTHVSAEETGSVTEDLPDVPDEQTASVVPPLAVC